MTFLPIVERELRIAARRPATYWFRAGAALAAIAAALLVSGSMSTNRFVSSAMVAKQTFSMLSALMMVFSLFAGMFATADCLSSEKRDGTLGLLFLTDLHGYDVVLGKLAASSLSCCYGLVSMLPILAIPLLAGGVTAGEFWRVVLLLLGGLFFSLGIGMFVSSVTRDSRQSLGLAFFIVIFFAGILPALRGAIWLLLKVKITASLLWPSLGYTLTMAYDGYYSYKGGAREYWASLQTITGLGLLGLIAAGLILPRAWQGSDRSSESGKRASVWQRMRLGSARRRQTIRDRLPGNPYHWLTVRDRLPQVGFWMLAVVVMPIWLLFFYSTLKTGGSGFAAMVPFQLTVVTSIGMNLIFKCLVTAEASRRLNDDRKSGALELLLVTPLTERSIVDGQRRALRDQFLKPLILLECTLLGLLWLWSKLFQVHDNGIIMVLMVGNMAVLVGDFWALCWVGMWTGMLAQNHHRAILGGLLRILVVPWVLYFVMGIMGFFNNRSPIPLFVAWFTLCLCNAAFWAARARRGLDSQFRQLATGDRATALTARTALEGIAK